MALFQHPQRRNWDDVSDFVVHFTQDAGGIGAAHHFLAILRGLTIEARNRFGIGQRYEHCPRAVCLSEAPLHQLKRIAERRSQYGLGFRKPTILDRGGGPVFYAYNDQGNALREIMEAEQANQAHAIWRAAAFIEQPRPRNAFEWEREWRVPQDLRFLTNLVAFLTAPEDQHRDMRTFFGEEEAAGRLPAFRCPIIDLAWDRERLQEAV